jgi:peptide-methionine (R)-S-oxide reductase
MTRYHAQLWTVIGGAGILLFLVPGGASAQDPLDNAPLAPGSATRSAPAGDNGGTGDKGMPDSTDTTAAKSKQKPKPEFIVKSPAEWRKILSRVEFAVGRGKSTEPAFSGKYASGHFRGVFVCACCDAAEVTSELFSSQAKFESGTGWPSFYQAINNRAVQTAWDYLEAEPRVEVMCRRCGSHLGHVFDDGPPPTGLRFCINSAVIKLIPPVGEASSKNAASKASSKSKAKAKPRTSAKSAPKQSGGNDVIGPADSGTASTDSVTAPAAGKAGTGSTP